MMLSPALRNRKRIEMRLDRKGLPEVPLLGRYNHNRAELAVPEHTHGDVLEICFLVKGRQTYRVDGRDYYLRGGDVFVAFPHEQHSSAGNPQEKGVLYWIMLRQVEGELFGLGREKSGRLWKGLCGLEARHFRGSWKMKEQLDTLTALYHQPRGQLNSVFLLAEALGFVLEVLRCAQTGGSGSVNSGGMAQVQRYIRDHLEENMSVPQLAALAGLSVPRFKTRFKEESGVPPAEYLLRAKVEEAGRRLAEGGVNVTDVAYALGFSSSQYFATVFKRFTGRSPGGEVRKKTSPAGTCFPR